MVAELLKDRLKYFPKNQALLSFLNNKLWFFFLFTDATNISDGFGNLRFKRPQIGKLQAGFKVTIEQSCLELSNFRLFQKGAVVNQNKVNIILA